MIHYPYDHPHQHHSYYFNLLVIIIFRWLMSPCNIEYFTYAFIHLCIRYHSCVIDYSLTHIIVYFISYHFHACHHSPIILDCFLSCPHHAITHPSPSFVVIVVHIPNPLIHHPGYHSVASHYFYFYPSWHCLYIYLPSRCYWLIFDLLVMVILSMHYVIRPSSRCSVTSLWVPSFKLCVFIELLVIDLFFWFRLGLLYAICVVLSWSFVCRHVFSSSDLYCHPPP